MVKWMITGAGKNKPTKWGGGAGACKTSFKTNMAFKNKSGNILPVDNTKGEYIWENVKPGDKLYYNVETGADDKKPASDEFYFAISTFNWNYIIDIMNQVNSNATPEQLKEWETNEEAYINYLSTMINPSRMFLTYYSQVETSTSSGTYHGFLTIPNDWPTGPMQIALMYGYSDDAKTGDIRRIWENVFETATWIALAVTIIGAFIFCPATLGATCGVGFWLIVAVDVAEISKLAYDQYTRGLMANIGRNKYGCSFPDTGYVHIYNMVVINESVDPFNRINKPAFEKIGSIQSKADTQGFLNKNTVMLIVASAGLILVISSVMDGDTNAE